MLQTTAQLSFSAKFSPPPKKPSTRERKYLRSPEVKAMIRVAKEVGRHGVRDGRIILGSSGIPVVDTRYSVVVKSMITLG